MPMLTGFPIISSTMKCAHTALALITALLLAQPATAAPSFKMKDIDGSNGFLVNGIDEGDSAGWSVSSAGDINGDGVDDLVIGTDEADGANNERTSAGESYVVFGSTARTDQTIDLANLDGSNGFIIFGVDSYDRSGSSVSSAGDINNDGIDDLVIGAYRANGLNNASPDAGEVYVVYGSASRTDATFSLADLDGTNGFTIYGIDNYDYAGHSAAGAGDVNGDNIDDLIIGAYRADGKDNSSDDAGESYVVYGSSTRNDAALSLADLDGTNGFTLFGIDAVDFSGRSVGGAGDINDDGIDDLIIGAYLANGAENAKVDAGEAYIVYGSDSRIDSSLDLESLDGSNGFVMYGIDASDYAGRSVSPAGDVNADGIADIIVGAYIANGNSNSNVDSGESYLIYGNASRTSAIVALGELDGTDGFIIYSFDPAESDDRSGRSVSGAGDINGDGIDDLIIGAYRANGEKNAYSDAGESYVLYGSNTRTEASVSLADLDGENGCVFYGIDEGDSAGYSVSGAGDINGDGFDDVVIGAESAHGANNENNDAGESYVVYGGVSCDHEPTDPDLVAHYNFRDTIEDSGKYAFHLRGYNHSFVTTPGVDVDSARLDPALNARLWRPGAGALAILNDVSISATITLDANAYSPVAAKYSDVIIGRKALQSFALEVLPKGRVRFSWLRRGQRTVSSCTTENWAINAKRQNTIAASRSAGNGYVRIWLNGKATRFCRDTPGPLQRGRRPLYVGSWKGGMGTGATVLNIGQLDLYRRVLSGAEFRSLVAE